MTLFARLSRDLLDVHRCLLFVISSLFGNDLAQLFFMSLIFRLFVFIWEWPGSVVFHVTFDVSGLSFSYHCVIANVCNIAVNQIWPLVNQKLFVRNAAILHSKTLYFCKTSVMLDALMHVSCNFQSEESMSRTFLLPQCFSNFRLGNLPSVLSPVRSISFAMHCFTLGFFVTLPTSVIRLGCGSVSLLVALIVQVSPHSVCYRSLLD